MIWQNFLKPCLTAVFLFGFVPAAFAADLSAPAAEWTIGPILAKSDTGASYCSMKNTYAGGEMLVFARDAEGSNSIALDFSKDTLEAGRQYDVTLRVGVVTRKVTALGATRQVLIMQMGADQAFYTALRRKNSLVFNVQKQSHGFDLNSSVGDALSSLNDCADSLGSGAEFAQGTVPLGKEKSIDEEVIAEADMPEPEVAAAVPAPRKTKTASKEKSLKGELARLRAENQQLATRLAAAGHEEEIRTEVTRLKAENAQLAGQESVASVETAETETAAEISSPVALAPAAGKPASLKTLLENSVAAQQTLEEGDGYRWISDDIYGAAQELAWVPGKSFSDMAADYITQASSLCQGEFGHKTGAVKQAGRLEVLESEMTCLDGQNNPAAAVLFVADQGRFSVITQEGTLEQLTDAMFKRDSIIAAAASANGIN